MAPGSHLQNTNNRQSVENALRKEGATSRPESHANLPKIQSDPNFNLTDTVHKFLETPGIEGIRQKLGLTTNAELSNLAKLQYSLTIQERMLAQYPENLSSLEEKEQSKYSTLVKKVEALKELIKSKREVFGEKLSDEEKISLRDALIKVDIAAKIDFKNFQDKQLAEFQKQENQRINELPWYQRALIPLIQILRNSPEIMKQQGTILFGGLSNLFSKMKEGMDSGMSLRAAYWYATEDTAGFISSYREQCENNKRYNKIGSILGDNQEFTSQKNNWFTDLGKLHFITTYSNPVMQLADSLYDEGVLASSNLAVKLVTGEEGTLTYLGVKELQEKDSSFIVGKRIFDSAKIATAVAINPGMGIRGVGTNAAFSGVISIGQELKNFNLPEPIGEQKSLAEKGLGFLSRVTDSTFVNTANSLGSVSLIHGLGKFRLKGAPPLQATKSFQQATKINFFVDDLCDFTESAGDLGNMRWDDPLNVIGHILVMGALSQDLAGDGPNDANTREVFRKALEQRATEALEQYGDEISLGQFEEILRGNQEIQNTKYAVNPEDRFKIEIAGKTYEGNFSYNKEVLCFDTKEGIKAYRQFRLENLLLNQVIDQAEYKNQIAFLNSNSFLGFCDEQANQVVILNPLSNSNNQNPIYPSLPARSNDESQIFYNAILIHELAHKLWFMNEDQADYAVAQYLFSRGFEIQYDKTGSIIKPVTEEPLNNDNILSIESSRNTGTRDPRILAAMLDSSSIPLPSWIEKCPPAEKTLLEGNLSKVYQLDPRIAEIEGRYKILEKFENARDILLKNKAPNRTIEELYNQLVKSYAEIASYVVIYQQLIDSNLINPETIESFLDLGTGYWNSSITYPMLFPKIKVLHGIESDSEKIAAPQQINAFEQDFNFFQMFEGDFFSCLSDPTFISKKLKFPYNLILMQSFFPAIKRSNGQYYHDDTDPKTSKDYDKLIVDIDKLLAKGGKFVLLLNEIDLNGRQPNLQYFVDKLGEYNSTVISERRLGINPSYQSLQPYDVKIVIFTKREAQINNGITTQEQQAIDLAKNTPISIIFPSEEEVVAIEKLLLGPIKSSNGVVLTDNIAKLTDRQKILLNQTLFYSDIVLMDPAKLEFVFRLLRLKVQFYDKLIELSYENRNKKSNILQHFLRATSVIMTTLSPSKMTKRETLSKIAFSGEKDAQQFNDCAGFCINAQSIYLDGNLEEKNKRQYKEKIDELRKSVNDLILTLSSGKDIDQIVGKLEHLFRKTKAISIEAPVTLTINGIPPFNTQAFVHNFNSIVNDIFEFLCIKGYFRAIGKLNEGIKRFSPKEETKILFEYAKVLGATRDYFQQNIGLHFESGILNLIKQNRQQDFIDFLAYHFQNDQKLLDADDEYIICCNFSKTLNVILEKYEKEQIPIKLNEVEQQYFEEFVLKYPELASIIEKLNGDTEITKDEMIALKDALDKRVDTIKNSLSQMYTSILTKLFNGIELTEDEMFFQRVRLGSKKSPFMHFYLFQLINSNNYILERFFSRYNISGIFQDNVLRELIRHYCYTGNTNLLFNPKTKSGLLSNIPFSSATLLSSLDSIIAGFMGTRYLVDIDKSPQFYNSTMVNEAYALRLLDIIGVFSKIEEQALGKVTFVNGNIVSTDFGKLSLSTVTSEVTFSILQRVAFGILKPLDFKFAMANRIERLHSRAIQLSEKLDPNPRLMEDKERTEINPFDFFSNIGSPIEQAPVFRINKGSIREDYLMPNAQEALELLTAKKNTLKNILKKLTSSEVKDITNSSLEIIKEQIFENILEFDLEEARKRINADLLFINAALIYYKRKIDEGSGVAPEVAWYHGLAIENEVRLNALKAYPIESWPAINRQIYELFMNALPEASQLNAIRPKAESNGNGNGHTLRENEGDSRQREKLVDFERLSFLETLPGFYGFHTIMDINFNPNGFVFAILRPDKDSSKALTDDSPVVMLGESKEVGHAAIFYSGSYKDCIKAIQTSHPTLPGKTTGAVPQEYKGRVVHDATPKPGEVVPRTYQPRLIAKSTDLLKELENGSLLNGYSQDELVEAEKKVRFQITEIELTKNNLESINLFLDSKEEITESNIEMLLVSLSHIRYLHSKNHSVKSLLQKLIKKLNTVKQNEEFSSLLDRVLLQTLEIAIETKNIDVVNTELKQATSNNEIAFKIISTFIDKKYFSQANELISNLLENARLNNDYLTILEIADIISRENANELSSSFDIDKLIEEAQLMESSINPHSKECDILIAKIRNLARYLKTNESTEKLKEIRSLVQELSNIIEYNAIKLEVETGKKETNNGVATLLEQRTEHLNISELSVLANNAAIVVSEISVDPKLHSKQEFFTNIAITSSTQIADSTSSLLTLAEIARSRVGSNPNLVNEIIAFLEDRVSNLSDSKEQILFEIAELYNLLAAKDRSTQTLTSISETIDANNSVANLIKNSSISNLAIFYAEEGNIDEAKKQIDQLEGINKIITSLEVAKVLGKKVRNFRLHPALKTKLLEDGIFTVEELDSLDQKS